MSVKLKPGYKQTEVGVIPEDWGVKKLGKIAEIDPENISSSTPQEYLFSYISLEDVDYGTLRNLTEIKFKNAPSRARRKVKKDDVLIATVRPNLKSHLLIENEVKDWICSTGFAVVRCKDANSRFIFNHLFSSIIDKQIETLITGSNYPAINSNDVRNLQIPLPPTKIEQTAIATVLSDADALISGLEKLIKKKKNIKQGAMQELLTPPNTGQAGKKRLPGFTGAWEVKKLGEITEIKTGKKNNDNKVEEGIYPFFVRSQQVERINSYSFDGEAILIPGEGNIGSIYHYINGKFDYHQRVYKISNFKLDYCGKFIYYYIKQYFNQQAIKNSVKATVDSLRLPTFQEFEIQFPNIKLEQTAIAQVLSDMDTEIEGLEQKLAKYKMVKQGMMQELLTGKTRLI